jgi:hypothetical protein
MSTAARKAEFSTVRKMVAKLDDDAKLILLEDLQKSWRQTFKKTTDELRAYFREHPVSDEEIRRESEAVRQKLHEKARTPGRR